MSVTIIIHNSSTTDSKKQAYYAYQKAVSKYAPTPTQKTQAVALQKLLPKLSMYQNYINARKKFIAIKYCISFNNMLGVVNYIKKQLEAANITATIVETQTGVVVRF